MHCSWPWVSSWEAAERGREVGSGETLLLSVTSDAPYTPHSRIRTALVLPKEQEGDQDEAFHEEGVFWLLQELLRMEVCDGGWPHHKRGSLKFVHISCDCSLVWKRRKRKRRKNTPVLSKQKLQSCMNQVNSHWRNWSNERILWNQVFM